MSDEDNPLNPYSDAEEELIIDFIRKYAARSGRIEDRPLITDDPLDQAAAHEALGKISAITTDHINILDLHANTLHRLRQMIESNTGAIIHPSEETPEETRVTREQLNKLLLYDDVTTFFAIAGGIIEQLTIELMMNELVYKDRRSDSVHRKIDRMNQEQREWWLYITGILDEGEKSQIRRAYKIRNSLVHPDEQTTLLNEIDDVNTDIERTINALNTLHKKVYGVDFESRIDGYLKE